MSLFDTIQTPTLLLDRERAVNNIQRMAQKAAKAEELNFRPHFKTHQSAQVGEWFRSAGVKSITVSSLAMADYFARHGWDDITVAFPANRRQIDDINRLAGQVKLGLLVEDADTVRFLLKNLRHPVDAWIKIDTGFHRTGMPWDDPWPVVQLTQLFPLEQPEQIMRLRGFLTHAGHTYHAASPDEARSTFEESVERLESLRKNLAVRGIARLDLSVGDTPGCSLAETFSPAKEIRPGNFVFYDAQQIHLGACRAEDAAVALACPVVARHPERSEVVIHGGAVHLSKDYVNDNGQITYGYAALPEGRGWGAPLPGARVTMLSQEHGVVRLPAADFERVQVGSLLCIIPAHVCLTVTLMKRYLTLDGATISTMNE